MRSVIITLPLIMLVSVLPFFQQGSIQKEPLTKEVLIEVMQTHGLPGPELVKYVERNGVSFALSRTVEQELRDAASYLEPKDQEALIAAVRDKYRAEWNPYKRFFSLREVNPQAAYESGQEYLKNYGNEDKTHADDVRAFILSYEEGIRRASDPVELATKLLNEKKYEEAEKGFRLALERDPKALKAYVGLISTYEHLNRHDSAVVTYNQFVSRGPTDASQYLEVCAVFYNTNHLAEAGQACRQAVGINPADPKAHNLLGSVYYYSGEKLWKAAVEQYQWAVKLEPNNYAYLTNLGYAYNLLEDHKEAIRQCKAAQRLKLDYARAYNCVGEAYKDWEKEGGPGSTAAREAFQMAVALEPNDKRFQANLGDAYRGAKQYERAIKPYQEAIRLDPKYEAPHHGLGRTYLDLCMVKEATAEYAALKQLKSARADDLLSQIQKKKC